MESIYKFLDFLSNTTVKWVAIVPWQDVWGVISVAVGLLVYSIYIYCIFRKGIKPHVFSWFIWGIITGVAYIAQVNDNAGPGSWTTLASALACLFIAFLALFKGEKTITRNDWIVFFLSLLTIPIWYITRDWYISIILLISIEAFGFYPTIHKAWRRPYEEQAFSFFLNGIKFLIALFALSNISFNTAAYPLSLSLMNLVLWVIIIFRRTLLLIQRKIMRWIFRAIKRHEYYKENRFKKKKYKKKLSNTKKGRPSSRKAWG